MFQFVLYSVSSLVKTPRALNCRMLQSCSNIRRSRSWVFIEHMRHCCGCSPLYVPWPSFESLVLSRQGVCAWFLSLQVTIGFRVPVYPEAGGRQHGGWQISLSSKPLSSLVLCRQQYPLPNLSSIGRWDGYFDLWNNLVFFLTDYAKKKAMRQFPPSCAFRSPRGLCCLWDISWQSCNNSSPLCLGLFHWNMAFCCTWGCLSAYRTADCKDCCFLLSSCCWQWFDFLSFRSASILFLPRHLLQ